MEYRILPHGGEKIGVIGMGSSVVGAQKEADIIKTVRAAFDLGVNYFDMAGGHATIFPAYGKALHDIRSQVYLQVHFGADYTTGEYGWTTELDAIKKSVDWQLKNLQTDYIDFGFIHCLDEEADLAAYEKNGVLKYLTDLHSIPILKPFICQWSYHCNFFFFFWRNRQYLFFIFQKYNCLSSGLT